MEEFTSMRRTLLKATTGLAVGAAGIGAFAGTAAAHFPTSEHVRYRFGPHDILSAGEGATPAKTQVKDVNGDGRDDLVLFFRTDEAGFSGDENEAELRWDRDETRHHGLSGRDAVRFVGN